MPDCRWRRRWVPQLQTRSYGSTVVTVKSERASADQQVVQPAGFSSPEQLLRQAVRRCAPDVHQPFRCCSLPFSCLRASLEVHSCARRGATAFHKMEITIYVS
ncbi:unnamed protein product [Urochloa humidicola]